MADFTMFRPCSSERLAPTICFPAAQTTSKLDAFAVGVIRNLLDFDQPVWPGALVNGTESAF